MTIIIKTKKYNMATITQSQWLDFLNLLHNKLRNSKGIKLTEMPALLEISNFMLFRFMDNDCLDIELEKQLKFQEVYKNMQLIKKLKKINPSHMQLIEIRINYGKKCLIQLVMKNV